uniref:Bifunctional inhibitor/plant lipid transfer protein/seed storage helical domain-containing protein n=1 Tax=Leersia perrieri TaxID=77586 RepID=A0A0D9VRX7_9ORYZ
MAFCKSSIPFFLATTLLLLASGASGQTTKPAPHPPMTLPPAPAPASSMKCPAGIISTLTKCTRPAYSRPIQLFNPNPENCCPPITMLPNNIAARCVCGSLEYIGITAGARRNDAAGKILQVCNMAPAAPFNVDCSKA